MMRFLHVSIIWGSGGKPADQLSAILDLAEDWYSYGNGFYVLYTSDNIYAWQGRFLAIIDQASDSFFISEIGDMHQNIGGWMQKLFWDWLRKERQSKLPSPFGIGAYIEGLTRTLPESTEK